MWCDCVCGVTSCFSRRQPQHVRLPREKRCFTQNLEMTYGYHNLKPSKSNQSNSILVTNHESLQLLPADQPDFDTPKRGLCWGWVRLLTRNTTPLCWETYAFNFAFRVPVPTTHHCPREYSYWLNLTNARDILYIGKAQITFKLQSLLSVFKAIYSRDMRELICMYVCMYVCMYGVGTF